MNKLKIISGVLYFIVVCITAGMGIKFVSATEYFTYHERNYSAYFMFLLLFVLQNWATCRQTTDPMRGLT